MARKRETKVEVFHDGKLANSYSVPEDIWDEDADHARNDWRWAVHSSETQLGYWEWVKERQVEDAEDNIEERNHT